MGSFSKIFAMASWRLGYLYGTKELIEETIKVQDGLVVCAPVPSQMAGIGALESLEPYISSAQKELTERRKTLMNILSQSKLLEAPTPQGGTSAWAKIKDPTKQDSFLFSKALLEKAGLLTVPGSAFGALGKGHIRISFGNQPAATLKKAGDNLLTFERQS